MTEADDSRVSAAVGDKEFIEGIDASDTDLIERDAFTANGAGAIL
jgi:hypothetical protein